MRSTIFLLLFITFHSLALVAATGPGTGDKEIFDYPEQKGNCYGILGSLLNRVSSFSYDRKAIEIGHLFKSYLNEVSQLNIPGTSLNHNWHVERPFGVVTSLVEKRGELAPLKLVHASGLTLNVTRIAPYSPMLEIKFPVAPAPLNKAYSHLFNERPFVEEVSVKIREKRFENKGSVLYIPKDYFGTPMDGEVPVANAADFVKAIDQFVTPVWMDYLSRVASSVVDKSVQNLVQNIERYPGWNRVNGFGKRKGVFLPVPKRSNSAQFKFEVSKLRYVTQVDGLSNSELGLISMFIGISENRPIIVIHSRSKGEFFVTRSEDSIFTLSNDEQKNQDFLDIIFHPEIVLENKGMPILKFDPGDEFEPLDNFLQYKQRTSNY